MTSIENSLKNNDLDTLIEASHSLKSSSANIGAIEVAQICNKLEKSGQAKNLLLAKTLLVKLKVNLTIACDELKLEITG